MSNVPTPVTSASNESRREEGRFTQLEWGLVAIGVAFRLWQFSGNAALFIDEVGVARNIAERSLLGLLRPLDYGQVAPAGFLWVERVLWKLFHEDWALRVFALFGAIASLFLFRAVTRRVLNGYGRLVALGLFACAVPLIRYSSWVKQYSTDAAIALLLLLLAVRLFDDGASPRRRIVAGLFGFVAVWFSSSAVFVAAGLSAALIGLAIASRLPDRRQTLLATVIPWLVGALLVTVFATHAVRADTMAYMKEYWRSGFLPWPPSTRSDALWPWHALVGVFSSTGLEYPVPVLYTLLCASGLIALLRKAPTHALLIAGPIVATLGAAILHLYPFADRLILFLAPLFLLLLSANLNWASDAHTAGIARRVGTPVLALALLVGGVRQLWAEHPVYWVVDPRATLKEIGAQHRPGDVIFAWHRAGPYLAWYGPRYGLSRAETVVGGCWWGEPRRFVEDLDRVRGRARVWLIPGWGGAQSAGALRRYADTIGILKAQLPSADQMAIRGWLYDFTDVTRLNHASASDFPVTERQGDASMLMNCEQAYKR